MRETNYEWYDDYLNHLLLDDELKEFYLKLEKDINFKVDFEIYKETYYMLETEFTGKKVDFVNNLKQIAKKNKEVKKPKFIFFNPKIIAIAAVFVLTFLVVIFQNNSIEYQDYNQHPEAAFVERSSDNNSVAAAQDFFNQKKYNEAVFAFENSNLNREYELQLFYAIALIEVDNYKKADQVLEKIIRDSNSYQDKAIWYLGLSQLKQKDYKSCKKTLMKLNNDAEDYEKAKEIIKELK
jgi:hypothetical protein